MKHLLLILLVVFSFPVMAQTNGPVATEIKKKQNEESTADNKTKKFSNLLPDKAFNKLIIGDITYAIFGEATPVSGIKVDVTKPEATITGVMPLNEDGSQLLGLEIKGGVTNNTFSIFKGTNLNSAFEIRPTYHWIPALNKARYLSSKRVMVRAKNLLEEENQKHLIDTFYISALLYNQYMAKYNTLMKPGSEVKDKTQSLPDDKTITADQKTLLITYVKKIMKNENLNINNRDNINTILTPLFQAEMDTTDVEKDITLKSYNIEILSFYNKYLSLYKNREKNKLSRQISNTDGAWTKKKYFWWSGGPIARAEKVTKYYNKYQGLDSSFFKPDYLFSTGINLAFNSYRVHPNKIAYYLKGGLNLSYSNNLSTQTSFNYETRIPFFISGNNVTEKTKSGTAYNRDDIRRGWIKQLFAEYYILPLNSFAPGLYISGNVNQSSLYNLSDVVGRQNDDIQISGEGGLVFNISNREKDKEKSLLSILFYARFEDLTDDQRTYVEPTKLDTKEDFLNRNLSMGIKVGIPISLPQRTK